MSREVPFDFATWVRWWDERQVMTTNPNDLMGLMVLFGQMRDHAASPSLDVSLAEAVSDSLAATTEGTDYAEAPEPSDEPGSPYVMRLTHELMARGVAAAPSSDPDLRSGLDVERLARAMHDSYLRDSNVPRIEYDTLSEAEKAMWRNHARIVATKYAALERTQP